MAVGQPSRSAIFCDNACMAGGSPCTRYVTAGGRVNPESQRRISPESAWADIESIVSMRARTGTNWPWIFTSRSPSTSRLPRVPAA